MPSILRAVGVPEEGLECIASATLHGRALATHPKPVADAGPLMSVWREAWESIPSVFPHYLLCMLHAWERGRLARSGSGQDGRAPRECTNTSVEMH